tara:strand:- start:3003 stop:3794 length:792 start_codon:yes stop_codon:yes gene_type:complete
MDSFNKKKDKEYNSIRLDLQTWVDVEKYLSSCKGIILPIGSTEQHGPTGAIGTDAFTAEAVSLEVGLRTNVLVSPSLSFGMAQHHLGFPGTMSLQPSTLLLVINDLIFSLVKNGFEKIYVINGHGGNIATLKAAFMHAYENADRMGLKNASNLKCKLSNWFMAAEVYKKSRELYGDREGQHATPSEISLTMNIYPCLAEKQHPLPDPAPSGPVYGALDFKRRYPDGRMGSDPFLASAEDGAVLLNIAAKALTEDLLNFLRKND